MMVRAVLYQFLMMSFALLPTELLKWVQLLTLIRYRMMILIVEPPIIKTMMPTGMFACVVYPSYLILLDMFWMLLDWHCLFEAKILVDVDIRVRETDEDER